MLMVTGNTAPVGSTGWGYFFRPSVITTKKFNNINYDAQIELIINS